MALFCFKKINKPVLVGDRLRQARKEQKMSLDQAVSLTRIAKQYLVAIEKNKFRQLPDTKAHCLAYIKRYARLLKLDAEDITRQFCRQANLENYSPPHPHNYLKIKPLNSIFIWCKRIGVGAVILLFISYLTWQVNGIIKPPKLVVYTPVEGYVSNGLTTLIQGQTENEVNLTINGKPIRINDKGKFETEIDLSQGINSITISATKKHGKTTTLTRHVICKVGQPSTAGQVSLIND